MDTAGIKKARFVSNSLGCQVLAEFTRCWPHRVDRLVLQGPTADTTRQSIFKSLLASAANGMNEPFSMSVISLQDYWRAGLRRAFALFCETAEYRISDVLQNVDNPTLLLSCELDPIVPCSWVAELSEKNAECSALCSQKSCPHRKLLGNGNNVSKRLALSADPG